MKIIIVFSLLTYVFNASAQLKKAIVVPANIDSMIVNEKVFTLNNSVPAPVGIPWFEYRKGNLKVLITAPHATAQMREGKIKEADGGTGSLALELNKLRGVSILYTTYLSPSDPNYYDNNEFKDSLAKILKDNLPVFVIDLHGSDPIRPYDVDFGTMNGKSLGKMNFLLDSLKNQLQDCGLTSLSLNYFSAEKSQTDTKFITARGIPCLQLEINSNYLSPEKGDIYGQKAAELLQALLRFIDCIPTGNN